jgi:putative spermidine/putrescine transport system permease protein
MTIIWYLVALAIIAIPFAAMVFLPINKSKPILLIFFLLFIVFMYGPMLTMGVLSLQGTTGSMTLPAKELFSFHWYSELQSTSSVMVSVRQGISKSLWLSLIVAVITAILSLTHGMAFRRAFRGSGILFYAILLSLMTPGLLLSLGLSFLLYYAGIAKGEGTVGYLPIIGVQAVWALPFGFLVMMSVFNRYDARAEEAARDLGASSVRTFREVTLPLIWPGMLAGFVLGFAKAMGEFGATITFVANIPGETQTLPSAIYSLTQKPGGDAAAMRLTLVSIIVSLGAVLVSELLVRRAARRLEAGDAQG